MNRKIFVSQPGVEVGGVVVVVQVVSTHVVGAVNYEALRSIPTRKKVLQLDSDRIYQHPTNYIVLTRHKQVPTRFCIYI